MGTARVGQPSGQPAHAGARFPGNYGCDWPADLLSCLARCVKTVPPAGRSMGLRSLIVSNAGALEFEREAAKLGIADSSPRH
jgi:hypothetical protein